MRSFKYDDKTFNDIKFAKTTDRDLQREIEKYVQYKTVDEIKEKIAVTLETESYPKKYDYKEVDGVTLKYARAEVSFILLNFSKKKLKIAFLMCWPNDDDILIEELKDVSVSK